MKKMIPYAASSLFLVFAVFLIGQKARPASLVDQWEEVEEATKKGLPKTAIEKLDPLIERALKEKAHAVAIRAIAQKINLEGAIEGNKPEEKIARMEAEMAKAPKELQPMMNAVLSKIRTVKVAWTAVSGGFSCAVIFGRSPTGSEPRHT